MTKKGVCLILVAILMVLLLSLSKWDNNNPRIISELTEPNLVIKEGLLSLDEDTVIVRRNDKVVAKVILGKPVMVAQAEKEEKWGFFQFPGIYRNEEGNLIVAWQEGEDSFKAYGKVGEGMMMSTDEGGTWRIQDKNFFHKGLLRVDMRNGDILQVNTPPSKDISVYHDFPNPVCEKTIDGRLFYFESELPEDLRGMYLRRWYSKSNSSIRFHANLDDPGLLRYSQEGLMPVLWLGDIKEQNDGSLVSGVYPVFYLSDDGKLQNGSVSFYRSYDEGQSWSVIGKIPYRTTNDIEPQLYNESEGFCEPAFEILNDGNFLCVMRTGFFSPLYKSLSADNGHHWSKPEAFTSNGVLPRLLKLGNGTLVLSSGRPGVQIRFNLEGDGEKWTEPIDFLPFDLKKRNYQTNINHWETCGYTCMMSVDDNTFYIVYSDFRKKDMNGNERKAIMFRKIQVIRISI